MMAANELSIHLLDDRHDVLDDEKNESAADDTTLSKRFKWLDVTLPFLLVFDLTISKALYIQATRCTCSDSKWWCTHFVKLCTSLPLFICIGALLYFAISLKVVEVTDKGKAVVIAVICMAYTGLIFSRILTFFYYIELWRFPWQSTPKDMGVDFNSPEMTNHKSCITRIFPAFLAGCLIILFVFDIMDILTQHAEKGETPEFLWEIDNEHSLNVAAYATFFVFAIFIWYIPLNLALIIQCVICYKYNRLLKHFKMAINSERNKENILGVFREYHLMYRAFQQEFNWKLKYSVQIAIVSWTFMLWIDMYDTKGTIVELISHHFQDGDQMLRLFFFLFGDWVRVVMTGSLYLISGCILTEKFEKLKDEISEQLRQSMFGSVSADEHGNDDDGDIKVDVVENRHYRTDLAQCQQYVNMHPIRIELGSLVLTKKSSAVLFLCFIASQFARMLFEQLNAQ